MLVSTSMASSAAGGRGDVRGVAVVVGGRWMPCGGVILSAGGALTVSTSMAVGGGGGGGAEDGGVEVVTGGTVATGVGKETGGEPVAWGRVSSGGEGGSRGACWDRQVWCGGARIHRRGGMR